VATLHANNAYHALNRIANFFPLESRSLLFLDLSVALKCIISQRLVKRGDGIRIPAAEILMNTRHVADLIEKGLFPEIKEAMEQSLAPGSQTFEQDLFRLYGEGTIALEEALGNADSPTNLSWLINNQTLDQKKTETPSAQPPLLDFDNADPDGASFKSFTLHMDDETA
jgi:twitching motility protein PilU